ncbi:MAG: thiol-disulfide oxidoreductase DCC family protein [Bacteroidota bacterium]
MVTTEQHTEQVILFDGVCNMCNSSVNFVIDHDPQGKYSFAALQSDFGREQIQAYGGDPAQLDSIVLIKNGKVYKRSRAALEVAKGLSGLLPLVYVFRIVPPFIRDAVYNWVAKNRYKWFGKRDECRIPTPELRSRFVGN